MKAETRSPKTDGNPKSEIARLLAVLATIASLTSRAQSTETATTNKQPAIVVTGTRLQTTPEITSSPVTVISRDEIDQLQMQLVADVLRAETGVDVARTGQPGSLTSVFLRGANASHTLVLVDGIRVNNAYNNAYDFNNLAVDNIERIEVLRGPQSTLYGSEALGGVINIVTKRGGGDPAGSVQAEYGSNDFALGRGSIALATRTFSFSAEAGTSRTDNERINSDYESFNVSSRAGYTFSDRITAGILANYLHSDAGSPNDIFTDDPNDRFKNENWLIGLNLDANPADWWDVKLTASHARERGAFEQPAPNPPFFFGDYNSETVAWRDQVDWQNVFQLADEHRVLAGLDYERSKADFADTYGGFTDVVESRSAYAQYEFAPVEQFTATAGGRLDDFSSFGTRTTYHVGTRWTMPVTETTLRANVGTAFRAPSIRELYYPFYGNPALQPEESLGWDVGFVQPFAHDRIRAGVTYFHNDFDNLINGFPPVNVNRARTLGFETFVAWQLLTNLSFRAAYTWMDATDRTTGLRLERRPEHRGSFTANWRILPAVSAVTMLTLVGDRPDSDYSSYPATRFNVPGYAKWDLALNWMVSKNLSIHGRAENITDEQYEEVFGFPALGRTFTLGAKVAF
jgi:vitamin B12 transporter